MKIGFFDSGLGGLTILKAVAKALPRYEYEFYGDTANVPYGDKSEAEIFALTKAGVEHLLARDCALVIVACNTASAETLRQLQDTILVDEYATRRLLGVIIPTVESVQASTYSRVAMIATKRTVNSRKYEAEFAKSGTNLTFTSLATPTLVPLIEAGQIDDAEREVIALTVSLVTGGAQGLILGCTHYTLLKDALRTAYPAVTVFSQDEIIPTKLADYLSRHPEIETKLGQAGKRNIYLTDPNTKYDQAIASLLGGVPLLD
jgi:glutamate racemase